MKEIDSERRLPEIETELKDWDRVHWKCTTSSSCKRSCLMFVITLQFIIIFVLGFTLRSFGDYGNYDVIATTRPSDSMNRESSAWLLLPDKMERLNENPVYAKFNISRKQDRPKVNLLMIISSAPKRGDRRAAIRDTWWNQTKSNEKVKVKAVFMTDEPDNTTLGQSVLHEQQQHHDVEFQKLKGGVEFGRRFLYHMVWAMQNYDFDYFLRMDDDYFFCLERFLQELPLPMRKMYHWGFVHCVTNIVRPEESAILLSRDLFETFLSQDPKEIKGHPWADQMIATWVQEMNLQRIYNHETRLHHHPPLTVIKNITNQFKNVCRKYIGVHGSYPEHMRLLWKLREGKEYVGVGLDDYTVPCNKPQVFVWSTFTDEWRYAPKRLIENPVWDTFKQDHDAKVYRGRQEGQG